MKRGVRAGMGSVAIGVLFGMAGATPAVAAPEEAVLPVDPEPVIDATGASSGVAPTTTEPVLVTAVPLPPDPLPEPVVVDADSREIPDDGAGFVINGPATVADSGDLTASDVTSTTAPSLVINGPATVATTPATTPRVDVAIDDPEGVVAADDSGNGEIAEAAQRSATAGADTGGANEASTVSATEQGATSVDPAAQVLPATGQDEVTWSITIATVLLVVGVALLAVRRRTADVV